MTYKAFCSNYGDHSTNKQGPRCWNEEAIETMADAMEPIWDSFADDLDIHLDRTNEAIVDTFATVLRITSRNANPNIRSALRTFTAVLKHRRDLARAGVEQLFENLEADFSSFQSDALSPVQTAYIGKLMQETYHAANMQHGKTSLSNLYQNIHLPFLLRHWQRPPPQDPHDRPLRLQIALRRTST
jgi:hypothetical protein